MGGEEMAGERETGAEPILAEVDEEVGPGGTGAETEPETGSETGAETEPETGSETGTEPETEPGTETGTEPEPEPGTETDTAAATENEPVVAEAELASGEPVQAADAPTVAVTIAGSEAVTAPAPTETDAVPGDAAPTVAVPIPAAEAATVVVALAEPIPVLPQPVPFGPGPGNPFLAAPAAPRKRRKGLLLSVWALSAVAVGAGTGVGINAAAKTDSKPAVPVAAPSATPSKSQSGVRADGTHYGSIKDFMLPMPDRFQPGPDEGGLGNDDVVTAADLDSQVSLLFGTLPSSDMSSAKGAMQSGRMKDGAVRTFARENGDLDVSITALQLDPSVAAKSTGDFVRVVKASNAFRTGPGVPGYPDALCVLPETWPGDPLDEMTCLATVGDTFVVMQAGGVVPLDTKTVIGMFGQQLDLFKNGPGKK